MGLPGTAAAEGSGTDVQDLAKRLEKSEASRAKLQNLLKQAREIALNNRALLDKHQRLEQEYQVLKQSAEQVTNELEAEKEEADKKAAEEARKRQEAERREAEESRGRKEAEKKAVEELRKRKEAEKKVAEEAGKRRDAEQRAIDLAQLQKAAERKGSEEAARRGAAEKKASEEARGRREAEAAAASLRSTLRESQAAAKELQCRVEQQLQLEGQPWPLEPAAAAAEAAAAPSAAAPSAAPSAAAAEAAIPSAAVPSAAARVDSSTQTSNELERTASAAAAATEHGSEEGSTNELEEAEFPTALHQQRQRRHQRRLGLCAGLVVAVEHVLPELSIATPPGASDLPLRAQQQQQHLVSAKGKEDEEEESREEEGVEKGRSLGEPLSKRRGFYSGSATEQQQQQQQPSTAEQQLAELRRQVEQQHAEALSDALKRAELLSEEVERLKGAFHGGALLSAPALPQEPHEEEEGKEDLIPHEAPSGHDAPPPPASAAQQQQQHHKRQQQQQQQQQPVVPEAPQRSPLILSSIDSPGTVAAETPLPGGERGRRQQQQQQQQQQRVQEATSSPPRPPPVLCAPSCPLPLARLLPSPSPADGDVCAAGFGPWQPPHALVAPPALPSKQQRDQQQQQQQRGLHAKRSRHSSEGRAAAGDEQRPGKGGGGTEPGKKRRTAALDLRETEEAEAARRAKGSSARASRGGISRSTARPVKAPGAPPPAAAAPAPSAAARPERKSAEEDAPPMAPASPPRLARAQARQPQASMTTDPAAELDDRQSQGAEGRSRRQGEACLSDGAASEGLNSPAEQQQQQHKQHKQQQQQEEEQAAAELPEASEAVLEEVSEAVLGYVGRLASGASDGYSPERQSEAVLALELLVAQLGAPWALANVAPQLWEGGSAASRCAHKEEVEEGCGVKAVSRAACLELLGALGHALLSGCRGAGHQSKAVAAAAKGSPYPRDGALSSNCGPVALGAAAAICSGLVEALLSGSVEGSSGFKASQGLLPDAEHCGGLMWRLVESTVALAVAVCDASRGPRRRRRRKGQQHQHQDPAAAETMEAAGELLLQVELWLRGSRFPGRVSSMPASLRSLLRTAGLSVV